MGSSWARLGQDGSNLGPTWTHLAPTWAQLGPNVAQLGRKLTLFGNNFGPSWAPGGLMGDLTHAHTQCKMLNMFVFTGILFVLVWGFVVRNVPHRFWARVRSMASTWGRPGLTGAARAHVGPNTSQYCRLNGTC